MRCGGRPGCSIARSPSSVSAEPGGLAGRLETHFSGRPHVGSVRHVEGMELDRLVTRVERVIARLGLESEAGVERVGDRDAFHLRAGVPAGTEAELWIVATE